MILITVGTAVFPFHRMATLVTHLSHIRSPKETIVYQHGHTPVHFLEKNIEAIKFMPHADLRRLMKRARIIVCHGGPATIFQALSAGIIPKVLPRKKWYGEHLTVTRYLDVLLHTP
jgi:UDP-N-acetylglucosamine transferase subunit ALG13